MDIARIRILLGECFTAQDDPRTVPAEDDYSETEQTFRALKSVFESELRSRSATAKADVTAPGK